MKSLTRFAMSERALADAKTVTEITEVCSFYEGIRKTARGLKNRDAEIEAAEFIIRARRRLGELLEDARKADALAKGARTSGGPGRGKRGLRKTRVLEPTLAAAGVDKNLAHAARQIGKLAPEDFNQRFDAWKQGVVIDGVRITTKLPEPPPQEKTATKVRANSVSLSEWKQLSEAEQRELLQPPPSDAQFNTQDTANIEWGMKSWNVVTGCKHPCEFYCYAREHVKRFPNVYPKGWEPTFWCHMLHAPANTPVPAEAATDTRFKNVFVCSIADLFGRWIPRAWIEAILKVVRENPQWNFLFLTKFPNRYLEFDWPPNAWLGTTVDLQARVANAEAAFAKLREKGYRGIAWLSVEPMLEAIKFTRLDLFQMIVIGGASRTSTSPEFRPPHHWIHALIEQAKAAGCAIYEKTNLYGNRILELPFDAPVKRGPTESPAIFHYLKHGARK
jgi:protein gp37